MTSGFTSTSNARLIVFPQAFKQHGLSTLRILTGLRQFHAYFLLGVSCSMEATRPPRLAPERAPRYARRVELLLGCSRAREKISRRCRGRRGAVGSRRDRRPTVRVGIQCFSAEASTSRQLLRGVEEACAATARQHQHRSFVPLERRRECRRVLRSHRVATEWADELPNAASSGAQAGAGHQWWWLPWHRWPGVFGSQVSPMRSAHGVWLACCR